MQLSCNTVVNTNRETVRNRPKPSTLPLTVVLPQTLDACSCYGPCQCDWTLSSLVRASWSAWSALGSLGSLAPRAATRVPGHSLTLALTLAPAASDSGDIGPAPSGAAGSWNARTAADAPLEVPPPKEGMDDIDAVLAAVLPGGEAGGAAGEDGAAEESPHEAAPARAVPREGLDDVDAVLADIGVL